MSSLLSVRLVKYRTVFLRMSKKNAITGRRGKAHQAVIGTLGSLEYFIELANCAQPRVEIPDLMPPEFRGRCRVKQWQAELRRTAEALGVQPAIVELAQQLPGDPMGAFVNACGDPEQLRKMLAEKLHNAYRDAQRVRRMLAEIARSAKSRDGRPIPVELPSVSLDELQIDPKGIIEVMPTPLGGKYRKLLDALRGKDATRIRECPTCGQIYWAGRKDKIYCSDPCRLKKWIEHNPEEWSAIQRQHESNRGEKERAEKRAKKEKTR
jgi:hypothetical protein